MNKCKYVTNGFFVAFCLLLASCVTQQPLENKTLKNLPSNYVGKSDSSNISNLNYKQFFRDTFLLKLIDTAIINNLDIYTAMQRIEIARANARATLGALLPNLGASISAAQRRFGLYTMDGAGNISTEITPGRIVPIHLPDYYVGLTTSWEIDIFGKLKNQKKAAAFRYLSSVEGRNLVITNLVADVANTYYTLLALDNELDIISENIQLQQNAYEIVTIQKQAGTANELAVRQFEAQLLNSRSLAFEIFQNIIKLENLINFLLNKFPQEVKRNKSEFVKPLVFDTSIGVPSNLLINRPDIRKAELELLASGADVKAAKAKFYPSLNLAASIGFQAFNTNLLFSSPESIAYGILGGLTQPLLNRSAIQAQFKTATALQLEALYNYQKSILNGFNEVYLEVSNIRNLEQIHSLKSSEVAVLSQAIDASSVLFRTGRANYIEVLMTQKSTLASRIDLVSTRQRQYNSIINLYKALGGGWR